MKNIKGIKPIKYNFPFNVKMQRKGELYIKDVIIFYHKKNKLVKYTYELNNYCIYVWSSYIITGVIEFKPTDDIEYVKDFIYEYEKRIISGKVCKFLSYNK